MRGGEVPDAAKCSCIGLWDASVGEIGFVSLTLRDRVVPCCMLFAFRKRKVRKSGTIENSDATTRIRILSFPLVPLIVLSHVGGNSDEDILFQHETTGFVC